MGAPPGPRSFSGSTRGSPLDAALPPTRPAFVTRPGAPRPLALAALRFALLLGVLAGVAAPALRAQPAETAAVPRPYEVLAVGVAGTEDTALQALITQTSGLHAGLRVGLPEDPLFSEATRRIYGLGLFSDVRIVAERMAGTGVFLQIRVAEVPRLGTLEFVGVTGTVAERVTGEPGDDMPAPTGRTLTVSDDSTRNRVRTVNRSVRDVLAERVGLLRGRPVRPSDIERGRLAILDYYHGEGYLSAAVDVQTANESDGRLGLTYAVNRGRRLEVVDVRFHGNRAFSERTLRRRLKNTPEARWWRFWDRETFQRAKFDEDLQALEQFYQDRGYYGARVVTDTFYVDPTIRDGRPGVVVEVTVEEGPRYTVRNVDFEGNTLFSDAELRQALGVQPGDPFSRRLIERNLYYNAEHSDIASLYTDRGHLRFNIVEAATPVPGDSLDLTFEVEEGEVYEFGDIAIRGNTRTKDHVIRRELRTVPGQPYSRQAVERSVRELVQLTYFDQNSLAAGPAMDVNDEDRSVDLTYNLTEASSDQLELSGGWAGSGGLILQAGVTFNNFSIQNLFNGSAWRPLPMGDGQKLSLQVTTYGTRRQTYQVSFTEPWFRGRQTPVGFSLAYSSYRLSDSQTIVDGDTVTSGNGLGSASARIFYRQQLRWPDDFFQTGTDLGLRIYNVSGVSTASSYGLPIGQSRELTIAQSLTRNSLNNPLFPTAGSSLNLSLTIAPPIPGFIQYHKWDFTSAWYAPLTSRASISFRAQTGFIGSLNGDPVQFQRYLLGGSPLDVQGSFRGFGKDLVFLRGYPVEVVGPRLNGAAAGGRILTKYSSELALVALQTPQLSLAPYLFAEAGNTYDGLRDFDPGRLYRSAGVGLRVFLPILGLVDLNYGYQIDPYTPFPNNSDDGLPKWRFQFSLGGQ